jgi:hypothetical protein
VEALEEIEKNKENGWSIQQEGKSQIFSCGWFGLEDDFAYWI